jgi:hypothetical protein
VESEKIWKELLEPVDFFWKHKHYLHLIITSNNEADLLKWYGWVESRIRQLVIKLATLSGVKVFPFPESYTCSTTERPHGEGFFIGLEFERKVYLPYYHIDRAYAYDYCHSHNRSQYDHNHAHNCCYCLLWLFYCANDITKTCVITIQIVFDIIYMH